MTDTTQDDDAPCSECGYIHDPLTLEEHAQVEMLIEHWKRTGHAIPPAGSRLAVRQVGTFVMREDRSIAPVKPPAAGWRIPSHGGRLN